MDVRAFSVGLLSFGLFAGAGALVMGQSGSARPWIAKASLAALAGANGPEDQQDMDDAKDVEDNDDEEQVIPFDQAPAAVQAAALKLALDAKNITQVTREEEDDDIAVYEIEYTENGAKCSAEFTAEGDLVEMEKTIDASKIPPAALKALHEEYPSITFGETTMTTKVVYSLTVKVDGKEHYIQVTPTGDIEDDSYDEDDADADHDDADHGNGHGEGHGNAEHAPGSRSDPA